MKTFLAIALLATLGLMAQAELQPMDIGMPVNPSYTAQEWEEIYANQYDEIKEFESVGTPQPDVAGKVFVQDVEGRITNGRPASLGQFPWQAALVIDGSSFCGGSLISNQWVLSAAHCSGRSYRVVLGATRYNSPESGSNTQTSTNSVQHAQYNPSTINNDIRVIRLPSAVSLTNNISPIRLPSRSQQSNSFAGVVARVSGWGRTSDSSSSVSPTLNFADLTVITNAVCANTYGSIINASKVCCATSGGTSTCNGDSGGPLVALQSDGRYTEIGIVSFGAAAGCQRGFPVAFTRVTSYLDWIQSNTGIAIN